MNRNDLSIYERHSADWWNPSSRAFRSLHQVTSFRLELLRSWVVEGFSGRTICDVGCGGGLLCEPIATAGARVVGIDLSRQSLRAGRAHGAHLAIPPAYVCADATEPPLPDGFADGVLLADVLEHCPAPDRVVREAARMVRPGGWIYVNTINRTALARWLVVHVSETIGLIPRGTHDPEMFIRPDRLDEFAVAAGLQRVARTGESPRLWRTVVGRAVSLRPSRSLAIAYSVLYRRVLH